jgi:hypothetical protein
LNEVTRKFKIACIEYSIGVVKNIQPIPIPNYWKKVEAACQLCIDALNGFANLADASDAAIGATSAAHEMVGYMPTVSGSTAARAACRVGNVAAHSALANVGDDVSSRSAFFTAAAAARAVAIASDTEESDNNSDLIDILINIILSEYENKR